MYRLLYNCYKLFGVDKAFFEDKDSEVHVITGVSEGIFTVVN